MNSIQDVLLQCPCSHNRTHPLLLLAVLAGAWLLFAGAKRLAKSEGAKKMNKNVGKVIIVLVLIAGIGAVFAMKNRRDRIQQTPESAPSTGHVAETADPQAPAPASVPEAAPLPGRSQLVPRLVDLGASACIPCKMMAPILEELTTEFKGRFDVVFIDVWKNPDEARKHRINIIPTQIFYDAAGKELFRHEGFFSREDILGTWKKFGYDFAAEPAAPVAEK